MVSAYKDLVEMRAHLLPWALGFVPSKAHLSWRLHLPSKSNQSRHIDGGSYALFLAV
jgi:hypothetical protein